MKYTVTWKPQAERQLAEIWTVASDQSAVSTAADEIDRLLHRNPLELGESRAGLERLYVENPLAATFEVHEEDRLVLVLSIYRIA